MFTALKQFHSENGHADVPQQFVSNRKLGWWVTTQRRNFRKGKLTPKQIVRLDELGFDWSPLGGKSNDARWNSMLAELKLFRERHGHCRVPAGWSENPQLANWVAVQRRQRKNRHLAAERITALDAIGFNWRVARPSGLGTNSSLTQKQVEVQTWEAMFEMLKKYKEIHGNCLVPRDWNESRKLAEWVSKQRVTNNKGWLDAERCRKLEGLGFDWDPISTKWEEMFRQLVEFKKKYGHANVKQRSGQHAVLGNWVRNQRAAKKYKRPIIAERAKRLDEIGFDWMLVEPMSWEKMLAALVEFKRVHGHCNVPQKSREQKSLENKRLGKWVNTQRTCHNRGKLRADRKQQLDSIGFVWNLRPNLAAAR